MGLSASQSISTAAREVVSRQLNELQRRGWINAARGNVEIVDRSASDALVRMP